MNLYRRTLFAVTLTALVCLALLPLAAQRRKPHKLRATAVVELTTDRSGVSKATVIPVAILDQGRFYDASVYKASPQPMALESGIVYEVQKTGVPVGYVTVANASKSGMWTALGKWQAVSTVAKAAPTPAAPPSDDRPRLHRGEGGTPSATSSPSPTPSPSSTPGIPGPGSRPHIPGEPNPMPSPGSTPLPPTANLLPVAQEPQDSDRPVLRRRTESSVPTSTPTPEPAQTNAPTRPATPVPTPGPGTQTLVGVSDNETIDPRSYEFAWKAGEKEQMEAKLIKLAQAQIPGADKQHEWSFKNLQIRSFDLDLSNEAVMVLTAEAPGAYMTPNTKSTPGQFVSRYIALIARVDFDGVPQRLAVSVTDSSRLDVAPRLELVDAVDVDGDGYAELLFREYSFDDKGFIVYGVGRGTVTKVFEGASQPIK